MKYLEFIGIALVSTPKNSCVVTLLLSSLEATTYCAATREEVGREMVESDGESMAQFLWILNNSNEFLVVPNNPKKFLVIPKNSLEFLGTRLHNAQEAPPNIKNGTDSHCGIET